MAIKQLLLPVDSVKQSNELIRSRTNVANKTTSRLLACLIAQLHDSDSDFKEEYTLDIRERLTMLQDAGGTKMAQIREACKFLAEAKVWIERPASDKKTKDDEFDIIPYFSRLSYRRGVLHVKFNPEMKKFLLELKAFFTQYNLLEYLSLPSIYSQKLFELLKSYEGANKKGYTEFTLQDLHDYLDTPDSFRSDFRNFRIRILEKAHKDINKTSLEFAWEPIKTGRAVTAVRFIFRDKMREKVEKTKVLREQRAQSKKNNENFLAAYACAKDKKGICSGEQKSCCAICQQLILADVRKKFQSALQP